MSALSPLSTLPLEVQYLLYSYLGKQDLLSLSTTCREHRNSYYDESLQKELFKQHFPQFSFREHLLASEQYARAMAQVNRLGITQLKSEGGFGFLNMRDHNEKPLGLAVSEDGTKALAITTRSFLYKYSIENNKICLEESFHNEQNPYLLASNCTIKTALSSDSNRLDIWDCQNQIKLRQTIKYPLSLTITCLALNRQGTMAALGLSNHHIEFLDMTKDNASVLQTVSGHEGKIVCIVFRKDGKKAISLCNKHILLLWNLNESTITCATNLILHIASQSMVMVPDESRVIFSIDTTLEVHDFSTPEPSYIQTLQKHREFITCLASDLANGRVLSGSRDSTINIWQIGKNNAFLLQTIYGHQAALSCLALTPDGSILLSSDIMGHTIKIWRLNSLPHECITRALERCNSSEESPLDELPQFAKRNIFELLYKKLRHTNSKEGKAKIPKIPRNEWMKWGSDIFRKREFTPEKRDILQRYCDCLKFPRYLPEPQSTESMLSLGETESDEEYTS